MGWLFKSTEYCNWLASSWCHVYLSHPYVTSWSYLDAIASGTSIVASEINALREFEYEEIYYVDHRNPGNISDKVINVLEKARRSHPPRRKFPAELTSQSCFDRLLRVTGLEVTTSAWRLGELAIPFIRWFSSTLKAVMANFLINSAGLVTMELIKPKLSRTVCCRQQPRRCWWRRHHPTPRRHRLCRRNEHRRWRR